jgi:hypothetical protein
MIRHALLAASISLALASAGSAAPLSPSPQLKQAATADLVQVKKHKGKKWNKHHKHWNDHHYYRDRHWDRGRYRYRGRYWGRRFYYRPYYWRSWGCIQAGPVWYCP